MTYAAVSDQIVKMVREIDKSTLFNGSEFGRGFSHERSISPERYAAGGRKFNVWSFAGGVSPINGGHTFNDMELVVDYQGYRDFFELDQAIHSDARAIQDTLRNSANWGRPASTICILSVAGDEIFPYEVEDIEADGQAIGRRLVFRFPATHS